MAENKKSFILYADLIETVSDLPREIKGDLFQLILDYVNDKNPTVDDILLKTAFNPIKLQLKRDLKRWESFREKQSKNGKLGGRPPKNNETQSIPENPGLNLESQNNLNVTVTVTANVIEIEKNFEVLESQQIWKEKTMMAYSLDGTKFKIAFDAFKAQNIVGGKVKPVTELMDHFSKWYPKVKDTLFQPGAKQTYDKI